MSCAALAGWETQRSGKENRRQRPPRRKTRIRLGHENPCFDTAGAVALVRRITESLQDGPPRSPSATGRPKEKPALDPGRGGMVGDGNPWGGTVPPRLKQEAPVRIMLGWRLYVQYGVRSTRMSLRPHLATLTDSHSTSTNVSNLSQEPFVTIRRRETQPFHAFRQWH